MTPQIPRLFPKGEFVHGNSPFVADNSPQWSCNELMLEGIGESARPNPLTDKPTVLVRKVWAILDYLRLAANSLVLPYMG